MRVAQPWFCLFLLVSMPAGATSYSQPEREEILSTNGKYLLVVDPESEVHEVKLAGNPGTTLWSFEHEVWHFPFFVANDGQTVAVLEWRHVPKEGLAKGNCVTFYRIGETRVGVPFRDVYPSPPKTGDVGIGPIGGSWRTWYHDSWTDGEAITIETTGGGKAVFGFSERALLEKSWVGWRKPFAGPVGSVKTLLLLGIPIAIAWRMRKKRRLGISLGMAGH